MLWCEIASSGSAASLFITIILGIKRDDQNFSSVVYSLPAWSSVCMQEDVLLGRVFAFLFSNMQVCSMPVFLEELNLWSWTGPQECYYCSTHWFSSHGRHISSADGEKAGQKRGMCVGFLLVQPGFIIAEKKRTRFPLFLKDKPRTWRLLWGARCCVGRWMKKMLPPPHLTHSTVWPAGHTGVKLLEVLPISCTLVLPGF